MIDYASWVSRAERFVRQLNYLPGEWGISVSVAPPLSKRKADNLHKALPFGLPDPLREFYMMGSADCQCAYQWSPHKKDLPKLENVFPHMPEVYGGARIIAASKLKKAHDVHEWVDGWDESLSEDQTKAKEIWLSTVPFVEIGNGDYLGLHVSPDRSSSPVVYLCHDDEECPVTTISPSFDTFLADWETLYYIGPEIWMLGDFLDNEGAGPLNVEQEKTLAWRELVGKGKW